MSLTKLAFGGGCHWCTEAVFDHLTGVERVEQGWISSLGPDAAFSEAVIVHFNAEEIGIAALVGVHLHTHSATNAHQLRGRYRSAVYTFSETQIEVCRRALKVWQQDFDRPLLTRVLPFVAFRESLPEHLDYYRNDPERPFCRRYIRPKLKLVEERFADLLKSGKGNNLAVHHM
ncbi:peptide methionine sulfoxide reductase [Lewinellaceae bacterium SD302]|nr:peptide methionine sulfoxide reductase [Lewinellaceae bacterium SD302]